MESNLWTSRAYCIKEHDLHNKACRVIGPTVGITRSSSSRSIECWLSTRIFNIIKFLKTSDFSQIGLQKLYFSDIWRIFEQTSDYPSLAVRGDSVS